MQRGLDGRRVAIIGDADAELRRALEGAGAQAEFLTAGSGPDDQWHGARFSALILGAPSDDARVLQLVREFLLSGKPVVAFGDGLALVERAGGTREDVISAVEGPDGAATAVAALADRFDDDQVDEMSDLSFPASDPPAVSPGSIGPAAPPARDVRS
jgi:hypothetical protein